MKYVYILSLLIFHPMLVLLTALFTAITTVVGSGHVTWLAYTSGEFTMWGYWVVTAAVVTIALAFNAALRGKADADDAAPLMPEIRFMLA